MQATTRMLSAFTGQVRWSEGHIFAITPEQIGVAEGLRASLAIGVMLFASLHWHLPELAYGAVAAFWTCLCDPGGAHRVRLKVMATFALGATLAISVAAYFSHWGTMAGGATLFVLVLVCGLTRSYRPSFGPMPAPVGLIAAIAVVVGVTSPRSAGGALVLAAGFFAGALWALVLCLYLWRSHPRAPARRALAAIFRRLDDMAASLQQLDQAAADEAAWSVFNEEHRRAVRFSIERGRESVARLTGGRMRFGQGIDAAGRVFAALVALGQQRANRDYPLDPATEAPLLDGLRQLLQEAALQSGMLTPQSAAFLKQTELLQGRAEACRGDAGPAVSVAAGALIELGRRWQAPEEEEHAEHAEAAPGSPFQVPAIVWRQALRTAVAVTVSYAIGALYDVSFSYWGTIATLVLMQPLGANTWLRVVERAVGSMIGGVLTAVLIARLSGPWEMLMLIAPLCAAVIALRLVNYGLFVVFLTPMFVLVSDFIHPASNLIATRAINEVIGACIGLAGSFLLWPEKEKGALTDAMLAALSANMAFASGVLRAGKDGSAQVEQLRRDAGVTSSRAEVARQRMLLEGRGHAARLDEVREVLVALRAICGAANIWAIGRHSASGANDGDTLRRADRYDAAAGMFAAALAGAEHGAFARVESGTADDLERAVDALALALGHYAGRDGAPVRAIESG